MSKDEFWKRYFYRVHQIRQEEETRKALLQGRFYLSIHGPCSSLCYLGTVESDEDFSWEDEDGDEDASVKNTTPTSSKPKTSFMPQASTPAEERTTEQIEEGSATPLSPQANTPANTSPRHSSEDSYDLVSSGNVSGSGDGKDMKGKPPTDDSDDGDSDWE